MFINKILFALLVFGLMGCRPAATALPVAEPTSAATFVVPTQTPLPSTATPIPTLADIYGTWTHSDPDRGTLFLIFNEDGTYRAAHGSPESVVHAGNYTLEEGIVTFVDGWDCSSPEEIPGRYSIRLSGTKYLIFTMQEDACEGRPEAFKDVRWDRVVQ